MTVNQALSLSKQIRNRITSLEKLRSEVSTTEKFFDTSQKEVKPEYNVKFVDAKIVELQKILFDLDVAIKQSNAVTEINVIVSIGKIFEPLV